MTAFLFLFLLRLSLLFFNLKAAYAVRLSAFALQDVLNTHLIFSIGLRAIGSLTTVMRPIIAVGERIDKFVAVDSGKVSSRVGADYFGIRETIGIFFERIGLLLVKRITHLSDINSNSI